MNPPNTPPSIDIGRFDSAVASFGQTVEGLKAEKTQVGVDAQQRQEQLAEMQPRLATIRSQAKEARESLQQLVEQSDIFKDVRFSNFWDKSLWETKQRAISKRMELAKQVDAMKKMLAAHGVDDNHETMQELDQLRTDATPNIAERGAINAGDFAFRHPFMAVAVGIGAYLANNALKPKDPANDTWIKRLLRWSGIGLLATIFVNAYVERDRRKLAQKAATTQQSQEQERQRQLEYQQQQQLFESPMSESMAYNIEGSMPQAAWSRATPDGVMSFHYPYNPMPPYDPMPMPYPRAPYPMQPGGMYYTTRVAHNLNVPPFYPNQSRSPYPSGGRIA